MLASYWREFHGRTMIIKGYVDAAESQPIDRGLGGRRAEAVAAFLEQVGVDRRAIYVKGVGLSPMLVPTPPGIAAAQNRRVEFGLYGLYDEQIQKDQRECAEWLEVHVCEASPVEQDAIACNAALHVIAPGFIRRGLRSNDQINPTGSAR
jgi:hypothetical protein